MYVVLLCNLFIVQNPQGLLSNRMILVSFIHKEDSMFRFFFTLHDNLI